MQIKPDQLGAHLQRGLAGCYVISGDETLICLEAQDDIRRAARQQGFDERQVFHADARTDWSTLQAAAATQSLFAPRQILEIRLPSGKPGKNGAQALRDHVATANPDLLTIISLPQLDWASRKADWVQTLQAQTIWVDVTSMTRERLTDWLSTRLARQEQNASRDALAFLVERVEGNLLAANQEIAKLGLLHGPGPINLEQVRQAVFDVARFDIADLASALLTGDHRRTRRLIEGLRAEGQPFPLILWVLGEEIRGLIRLQAQAVNGRLPHGALRGLRMNTPPALIERILPRLSETQLRQALSHCAQLDRLSKGLDVKTLDDDPWVELADLAIHLLPARP
jgi:DNA polymerase-3 subunit delta